MRVIISYSVRDVKTAELISKALTEKNINVTKYDTKINRGSNIIERINDSAEDVDAVIVLLSRNYLISKAAQQELLTWRLKDKVIHDFGILFVVIDNVTIPSFIQNYVFIDFKSRPLNDTISTLVQYIQNRAKHSREEERKIISKVEIISTAHLNGIKAEYNSGNLCLFCGAGVSIGAGIPGWTVFLRSLLMNLLDNENIEEGITDISNLAELYQEFFNHSSLIIAQYLKNSLGNDFLQNVRDALYENNPESSSLIDTICELCRPQRDRNSLDSIVTFNFDDLIEYNLEKRHIKYNSIYNEGQRCRATEIPIYHVHGYLPRDTKLTKDYNIVLSEDAYHSQFIDPFSWSNLVQLNHLNNHTCLLVGLSLTDPNLRRLLDVSSRKNPSKDLNHYIFKKRYNKNEISSYAKRNNISIRKENAQKLIDMTHILEEKDANNLGLNVIWINDFEEISIILNKIIPD